MDISSIFDISAAGMNLERQRLEVSALNLANANTTRGADGLPFTPLQVVVRSKRPRIQFGTDVGKSTGPASFTHSLASCSALRHSASVR